MAKQIKLRRDQQKARRALLHPINDENGTKMPLSQSSPSSKAQENIKKEMAMFITNNKMLKYSTQDSTLNLTNESNSKTLMGFISDNVISQENKALFLNKSKNFTTNVTTTNSQLIETTAASVEATNLLNSLKSSMTKLENLSSDAKTLYNNSYGKTFVMPFIDSKKIAQFAINQNSTITNNNNNNCVDFNFPSTTTQNQQQLTSNQFRTFNEMPLLGISTGNNNPSTMLFNLPQSTAQLSPILTAAFSQENNENVTRAFSHLPDSNLNLNLPMPKPIHPFDSLKAL